MIDQEYLVLCKELFMRQNENSSSKKLNNRRSRLDPEFYAKKRICKTLLDGYIPGYMSNDPECSFEEGFKFIEEKILSKADVKFFSLLCHVINNPRLKSTDLTENDFIIIKQLDVNYKSIIVYSRIIHGMSNNIIGNEYLPIHYNSILIIISAINFLITSLEFKNNAKDLPF